MLLNVWGVIWPEPEEDLGIRCRHRRAEGTRTQAAGMASRRELRAVDSHAHVHGGAECTTAVLP